MHHRPSPRQSISQTVATGDAGTANMPVVVWRLSPRIDDVLGMLAQNAFATSLLDSCNAISQNATSPCQRVALMGLHQPPAAHAEILAVAQAFKHEGFRLVCYADASSAWSLAAQSRLLLAGGVRLLDSMDPDFEVIHLYRARAHGGADMPGRTRDYRSALAAVGRGAAHGPGR